MIISLEEKRGGIHMLERDSEEFKETIEYLGLIDIENINGDFTWSNKRSGSQHIACILDRFLVSETLFMEGFEMEANVLEISSSNHWHVQLWMDMANSLKKRPFRFEKLWLTHPEFQENHHQWWEDADISHG
jgi:hypothetical protein